MIWEDTCLEEIEKLLAQHKVKDVAAMFGLKTSTFSMRVAILRSKRQDKPVTQDGDADKKPLPPKRKNDTRRRPANIEVENMDSIDAIEAATEGLQGREAYLVGRAIECLWQWKRSAGAEDLRNAIGCLQRLLKGAK